MKFNKKEWVKIGRWVQPTISARYWDNYYHGKYPFSTKRLEGRSVMLDGHHFIIGKDIERIRDFIREVDGSKEILDIISLWIEHTSVVAKKRVNVQYDLISRLKNFNELFVDLVEVWWFFCILNEALTDEIKKICDDRGFDFEQIVKGIKPAGKSLIEEQNQDAGRLYKKIKSLGMNVDDVYDSELFSEVEEHVERFKTCGMHHFVGEAYSVEKFVSGFEEFKEAEVSVNVEIPKELEWHAKLASIGSYGRLKMAEVSGYVQYVMKPYFDEVNEKLGLNEGEYIHLSMNEMISGLENGLTRPDIEKRKHKMGHYTDDGEVILAGEEVDEKLKEFLDTSDEVVFPLKGMVACSGVAIGKAKIVIRPEDADKVSKGNILVAPETTPDFVPAMRIAGGVITDQGGVTSHAAIVSREFNLPCIVGVKNATVVLKDGQEVVVDGEKGEVRLV